MAVHLKKEKNQLSETAQIFGALQPRCEKLLKNQIQMKS